MFSLFRRRVQSQLATSITGGANKKAKTGVPVRAKLNDVCRPFANKSRTSPPATMPIAARIGAPTSHPTHKRRIRLSDHAEKGMRNKVVSLPNDGIELPAHGPQLTSSLSRSCDGVRG